MQVGFHLSIAKGFDSTLREAQRLGCEVVQIFVKNPRSWTKRTWNSHDCEVFRGLSQSLPVFAHLSYLPNLARIDEDVRNMAGFIHEIELSRDLGIQNIVVHCGSRHDRIKGMEMVARAVKYVTCEYGIRVLLENSAGQGNTLGTTFGELQHIYESIGEKNVALCVDTAHLFASGYDIRTPEAWTTVTDEIKRRFGLDKIGLFHLNDSKSDIGSKLDRHWHMGKGFIGNDAFKTILNDVRFKNVKGVMETPRINNMDEENMKVARSLLSSLVSGPSP